MMKKSTDLKAEFLDHSRVASGSLKRIFFTLRTGADHFARTEDQRCRSRIPNTHDHRSETFRIVFSIASLQSDTFQVQWTAKIDRRDNVPKKNLS